jgi:hypothetical protein
MSHEKFYVDPHLVELAEDARSKNQLSRAIEIATVGLEYHGHPIHADEISEFTMNIEQLSILACLARIQVDSLKSAANSSKLPRHTLNFLLHATTTIEQVYENSDIQAALYSLSEDHTGRTHHFHAEMQRDKAKTAYVASVLYPQLESGALLIRGDRVLLRTYQRLDDSHPVKPLIGIEYALSQLSQGYPTDENALLDNFQQLRNTDEHTNPHRVATVASWLAVRGIDEGEEAFQTILHDHPEWKFMIEQEQSKLSKQELRKKLFRLLTPMTTNEQERKHLYDRLSKALDNPIDPSTI